MAISSTDVYNYYALFGISSTQLKSGAVTCFSCTELIKWVVKTTPNGSGGYITTQDFRCKNNHVHSLKNMIFKHARRSYDIKELVEDGKICGVQMED